MVGALGVSFDLGQAEPGGFELLLGVKRGLIEIVLGVRIGVFAEDEDGPRLDLRAEIDDADEGMAGHSVAALLIFFRPRVEIENYADIARRARYWKTGHRIAERFFTPGLPAFETIDVAVGNAPGPEPAWPVRSRGCPASPCR